MAAGPLTEYFLSGQYEKDKTSKTKICTTYSQLLMGVRQAGGGSVTPSDIKKAVSKVAPQFLGFQQHDSAEFLRYMLNGMHDELNKGKPKQYQAKDFTNGETLHEQFAFYNSKIKL